MKISKNFNGLVTLGAVVALASSYIAESVLFNTALLPKMLDSCTTEGFLQKGTSFECQYTPMGLYALIGAIFFGILLTILNKSLKLKINRIAVWAFGYFVLTITVLLLWRELLVLNTELTDNSHLGYSYLILWLRAMIGMVLGMGMATVFTKKTKKSVSNTLKSTMATSTKALPSTNSISSKSKSVAKKTSSATKKTAKKTKSKTVAKKKTSSKKS